MRITKILHYQNKDTHALVNVQLDDGSDGVVYVGGEVEAYFAHGRTNVFVKKGVRGETLTKDEK